MSIEDRISALKAKHQSLEEAISTEAQRPLPDNTRIHDLKRRKLQIKDELATVHRT